MLIYIKGSESFLAREAITSLKRKYLEKNPTGTELVEIDASDELPNWADLKAMPLFASSRLIIIRRAGELAASEQDNLASMLSNLPDSSIIVLWDAKPLKAHSALSNVADKAAKQIATEPLSGSQLTAWIKKQAALSDVEAGPALTEELIRQYGSNLWAIKTDLMTRQGVDTLLSDWGQTQSEKPFVLFDDIRKQNWEDLKRHFITAFERGEPLEMSIGSLAAAVRQSIKDESQRREIVSILSDVDLALKTGLVEAEDAVALLTYYLPNTQKRVQWEELCEQIM